MNQSTQEITYEDYPGMLKMFIENTGSVVKLLENTFNEQIQIECLGQGVNQASRKIWNDLDNDEDVLVRTVFLKGQTSSNRFVYASSYIRIKHLPEGFVSELMDKEIGIGELLEKYKLSTERQIIIKRPVYNRLIHSVFPNEELIYERQYIICYKSLPIIFITECYPASLYKE